MADHIVMTPKETSETCTTILIERRHVDIWTAKENRTIHVAGGDHTGIVINKELVELAEEVGSRCVVSNSTGGSEGYDHILFSEPPQVSIQFKVFLVSSKTEECFWERRQLRFWMKEEVLPEKCTSYGQKFFKELVGTPFDKLPKDYVGFLTKILKLMQEGFEGVKKIEVEFKRLDEKTEEEPEKLTERQLLEMIECAYPNPVSLQEIAKRTKSPEEEVLRLLFNLEVKRLIKSIDKENNSFTRTILNERNLRIVKQMPEILLSSQPTIAIITAHYSEKLAVDSMIENQETFVRYAASASLGESNAYTLGNIGNHRIVSMKLPSVGHSREAMITAGNRITRLLGTFQKVDYVFLIGVGGGVFRKDVRVGDVVVSSPVESQEFAYLHFEEFETRGWKPESLLLQEIAKELQNEGGWKARVEKGMETLKEQDGYDFSRPEGQPMMSKVHLGPVASGKLGPEENDLGILAFDSEEFDCVLESIIGNRKSCFVVIRGVADYKDGSGGRKEWGPHAALLAAAFASEVIGRMEDDSGTT
ncbi:hypothetical protein Ocin01_14443 [Orchesella cincta]|uniref:Winged helix-turn-helix domain-containing protein n=1 Tax=Orchesella cincta TaxID=48709 RepID=A0A1D2MGV6_ORCCI|nr:hypothetical protein Ocin01_14443 [Orchesella cincta]